MRVPTRTRTSSIMRITLATDQYQRRVRPDAGGASRSSKTRRTTPNLTVKRCHIEEFIDRLTRARIGATFNFYRNGAGAAMRCERLLAYLEARANAPLLLVGEAAGHR